MLFRSGHGAPHHPRIFGGSSFSSEGRIARSTVILMRSLSLLPLVLVVVALTGCGERAPLYQSDDPEIARRNDEGVMLMGRYDYDGAYEAFASLLEDHPQLLDVRTNLAIAQLNRQRDGDEAAAIAVFRSVLADDPSHDRARYGLGLLLVRAGEEEECREVFSSLANDVPDDPFVQYFLAQAIEIGRAHV